MRLIYVTFLVIVSNFSHASISTDDSLCAVLGSACHDTDLINAYITASGEYRDLFMMDSAAYYMRLASEKATAYGDPFFQELTFAELGQLYQSTGKSDQAIEAFLKSADLNRASGGSKELSSYLNHLGYIKRTQGNIPEALKYYHASLETLRAYDAKKEVASNLNNIGIIYMLQDDNESAKKYFTECNQIVSEVSDSMGMGFSLQILGQVEYRLGNKKKALEFYEKSMTIRNQINHKQGVGECLFAIGGALMELGDTVLGLNKLNEALELFDGTNNNKWQASTLSLLSKVHLSIGNQQQAARFAESSFLLSNAVNDAQTTSLTALSLYHAMKQEGNTGRALEMYELHIKMRDSIKNDKNQKITFRQQMQYEQEKKELIADHEKQEKERLIKETTQRRDRLQFSFIFIALLTCFGAVAGLGFVKVSPRVAEGLIFFTFLIFFEFVLVLADPMVDNFSEGAPGWKLLFNAILAGAIFPLHAFFERFLKKRLIK